MSDLALRSQLAAAHAEIDALQLQLNGQHPLAPRARREGSSSSFASTSTWRSAKSEQPKLLAVWEQLLSKMPPASAAERERRGAFVRIQAAARGWSQRRAYLRRREFFAVVSGSSCLQRGDGRLTSIPVYAITVMRAGRCWQVLHRYSDWLALHSRMEAHLQPPTLPALPPRVPFRSASVRARREVGLNKYLQHLLPLANARPLARSLLLSFLCRSHHFWAYGEQPVSNYRAVAHDTSSGSTPSTAVALVPQPMVAQYSEQAAPLPWQQGFSSLRSTVEFRAQVG
jgi:hypothetical protein